MKVTSKNLALTSLLILSTFASANLRAESKDTESSRRSSLMSLETIMDGGVIPDFSYAGYQNGLGGVPQAMGTVIEVADYGAVADDGVDDSAGIQRAIDAANDVSGPVIVRFAAGTYRVTSVLRITRSDFVLQGQGAGDQGTRLHFPRPLKHVDKSSSLDELRSYLRQLNKRQIEPASNIDEYFSEYSWSGGFIWVQQPGTRPAPYLEAYDPTITVLTSIKSGLKGDNEIVVNDPGNLAVGEIIQIQWINRDGPEGSIIRSIYGDRSELAGSHHWTFENRPLVRQTVRITDVDGQNITLADVLLHNADASLPAQIAPWSGLEQVGIEDLHIDFPDSPTFGHHLEEGYNGIYYTSAFDSWARNLKVTNADSGLLSYNSANLTLENIVTDGNRMAHYAVHMGNVHNVLAKNLRVFNPVRHSLTFNTQSTKCVYHNAEVFVAPVLDQHAGANHQNLFDNITVHATVQQHNGTKAIALYDGSGAGYWQPGHGGYNTTWNLNVLVTGGANPNERVTVQGLDEGPMALIVGLHGNREFELDYRPKPLLTVINTRINHIPSLYNYQLSQRIETTRATGTDTPVRP
jgi:hypothetical protein